MHFMQPFGLGRALITDEGVIFYFFEGADA